jgi:hypothetical protein
VFGHACCPPRRITANSPVWSQSLCTYFEQCFGVAWLNPGPGSCSGLERKLLQLNYEDRTTVEMAMPRVEPWPEPVDGCRLLDEIVATLTRFVVLPRWAPETLAL